MGKELLHLSIDGGIKHLAMTKIGRGKISSYIEKVLETEVRFQDEVEIDDDQQKINKLVSINAILKNQLEESNKKVLKLEKEIKEMAEDQNAREVHISGSGF